ncbi:MAG: CHAP domain-containing protein [Acutalibacteraceae bacterium]
MGNNIELKYQDLDAVISDFKTANSCLDNAIKVLRESTDLGSSVMQSFWKFGNKDAIFGSIKSSISKSRYQVEENEKLIGLLNSIGEIYDNAGKSAAQNSAFSNMITALTHLNFIVLGFSCPSMLAFAATAWAASAVKPLISTHAANTTSSVKPVTTVGVTPLAAAGVIPVSTVLSDVPNNTAAQEISNEIDLISGQCLNDIWQNWGPVSPNGFTNYNGKGNCTWYADQRWSQKNPGNPLVFNSTSGGNAKNWVNSIDKTKFNVATTSDVNNIQANAIAVSQSGTYGHVAYIEQVKDGMVYYTEDGESYTRPHTWLKDSNGNWVGPTVQCCTLEQFKYKFGSVITSK